MLKTAAPLLPDWQHRLLQELAAASPDTASEILLNYEERIAALRDRECYRLHACCQDIIAEIYTTNRAPS
jgi:hypothetical protein